LPNTKDHPFESDQFAVPKPIPDVKEPLWVTSRQEFLKYLTKIERNILLTGDPDQEFDPYTYIWIYTYPELAIQNPAIQQNFQHILQFEDNFDLEQNILLDQQDQQRGRSKGSRNRTDSWKNTAAPEWKLHKNFI
jgi:hypothetical protein